MPSVGTYVKAISAGAAICIGGPAFVYYISPTEEEIFKKYNPELQKRALANREVRQQEFDSFVNHLKEASRSEKPIWIAQKEMEKKLSEDRAQRLRDERESLAAEAERRRAEIRDSTK
ncbi:CBP4-domain-containing protein [Aaosphaeria arxii CBS 175.79]|uniref:Cytochrome b mRNA-processing protein 4 n=1 Tax=Aaosphaeria arxii CBS 175.79 TaxID=1450172 RepID=A0A6A5XYS0_9PLEO|nr:CBP4-domain-containing protein [Aaosphaeria arxii CBS 175.79]KAF2017424.1 CBP4-domain-containing protein [Aaosphaeria arxii CBS 175.79]